MDDSALVSVFQTVLEQRNLDLRRNLEKSVLCTTFPSREETREVYSNQISSFYKLPDATHNHSAGHYSNLCLRNDESAEFDENGQLDHKFFIDRGIKETRSSRTNLTNSKWKICVR